MGIEHWIKEQELQLNSPFEDSIRVGKLANAELLLSCQLLIHIELEESLFGIKTNHFDMQFLGEISSISEGTILFSNAEYLKGTDFSIEEINNIIDKWFMDLNRSS